MSARRALRRLWLRVKLWDLDSQTSAAGWKLEADELEPHEHAERLAEIQAKRAKVRSELARVSP